MAQSERVMLLIDADNVSVDVMEQAVRLLLQQHGGVHVRRAYCTAESALKHQAAFKRLAIKPMVNLAAGKNSTDIALAVDAIDLVLAERPEVVVIASSDSDFAPLVQRLREKGCVVRGIGQQGKTGDETREVYDDFTVLEHRKAAEAGRGGRARGTRRQAAPAEVAVAADAVGVSEGSVAASTPSAPARKTRRKPAAREAAPVAVAPPSPAAPAPASSATRGRRKPRAPAAETPTNEAAAPALSAAAREVLACLPELAAGQPLALNVAVQRLREAGLLGRNASSLKLFAQLGPAFELRPPSKPTQVRLAA